MTENLIDIETVADTLNADIRQVVGFTAADGTKSNVGRGYELETPQGIRLGVFPTESLIFIADQDETHDLLGPHELVSGKNFVSFRRTNNGGGYSIATITSDGEFSFDSFPFQTGQHHTGISPVLLESPVFDADAAAKILEADITPVVGFVRTNGPKAPTGPGLELRTPHDTIISVFPYSSPQVIYIINNGNQHALPGIHTIQYGTNALAFSRMKDHGRSRVSTLTAGGGFSVDSSVAPSRKRSRLIPAMTGKHN
jgi:hypothetical protein